MFTQAMNAGNGLAGMLNITVETIIRLYVAHRGYDPVRTAEVSFILFMSILVVLCCFAVVVYLKLVRTPAVQLAILNAESVGAPGKDLHKIVGIAKRLWMPALTQFLVLFVSLVVWPGVPCVAGRQGQRTVPRGGPFPKGPYPNP